MVGANVESPLNGVWHTRSMDFSRWADIRDELLERVARQHCVNPFPPARVLGLVVELLGYQLVTDPELGEGLRAVVDVVARTIRQNPRWSPDPRRCTPARLRQAVAHEIGHVVLHTHELLAGVRSERQEIEAEAFARVFLVPRQLVLRSRRLRAIEQSTGRQRSNQVAGLADELWVTPELVWVRLREAGLVEPASRVNIRKGVVG
ncbi:MAG: hypothetical protein AMXMBFR33_01920 [Candidatus Xenobia bacterium]